ncbi:MAG: Gluconolactonase [Caulobacter sp.]|nr:Gluconolactonase [Caulobacter sp.]
MSDAVCVWPAGAILGEGPLWSDRDNAVYWVDILAPAVHRYGLGDGSTRSWPMPEPIGWLIERRDAAGFIAGFRSGFALLELEPLRIRPLLNPEPERPQNRMNDAKADAAGRIWAGTMDMAIVEASGALYRFDPTGACRRMDDGYRITNGPAFSPDGRSLYHTDSERRSVYRFDLSPDGELGARSTFISFPPQWGGPDGMTTDAEGGLWIAHWGAGRVSRFTPDGRLDRFIPLPASQITSCVFAGDKLDRMFVTSAGQDLADGAEPLAGGLFEVDPGVTGLPTGRYAG